MTQKTQLISIIKEAMEEIKNLEQELPSEILHQKGTLKDWAIRDDVIHCAVYIQRFADRLAWPRDACPRRAG